MLSPFTRALGGVPFLYQKISSTSPLTALIASRSASTTFAVVYLDGRVDWVVAQRSALLAWTGTALQVKPKLNMRFGLAHWGQNLVGGRGLVGLVGRGQVYQVQLKAGEEYILHPANVLAYTATEHAPQPYRFRSGAALKLQIPRLPWADGRFAREMRKTATWRFAASAAFTLRTWARRTIWGDRLFLRFQGPTTILLQSRASRLSDSLTERDINEIADAPAGVVQKALLPASTGADGAQAGTVETPAAVVDKPTRVSFATVRSGKVDIRGNKV